MTDQEQINALKAQVNCLREALLEQRSRYHVAKDLDAVLEATPKQCLAEVKAMAIEDALRFAPHIGSNGEDYDYDGAELQKYANSIREQAK